MSQRLLAILSFTALVSACQNQAPAPLVPSTLQSQSQTETRFYDTARDGLTWAQMDARNWDFSARLAKVEGTQIDEQGRAFEWRYYFTAIGKNKALLVTSRREKREVSNSFPGGALLDLSWRVDSKEALEKAKAQGLKSFPVFSMSLDSFVSWEIRSAEGWFRVEGR
ncbi:MAG: hypothetical protein ACO1RX_03810 [Candidatus Sericytochromatia bacterium]